MPPSILTFATDCTGLDAPAHCLKAITDGRGIRYLFASDIDVKLQSFLKTMTPTPEIIFSDIHDRTDNCQYQDVDLYVAGFPCQSFSTLGKRKGFNSVPGSVFWRILDFLKHGQPRVFVLENTSKLLAHNKGATFALIMRHLDGLACYRLSYRTLSPLDIGFPQSRSRVFIIGIHVHKTHDNFIWPEFDKSIKTPLSSLIMSRESAIALQPSCARALCATAALNMQVLKQNMDMRKLFIVDLSTSRAFACKPRAGCCPCLKRHNQMFYISTQERYITFRECLRLQGFSDEMLSNVTFKTDRSKSNAFSVTDVHRLAGNSICIPLFRMLIESLLRVLWTKPNV
jgi:DNA (cytosine-5)-methyltransferase 1